MRRKLVELVAKAFGDSLMQTIDFKEMNVEI